MSTERIGIMIDLETLGLGPDAVSWQVGMQAFSLDTGSYQTHPWSESFLPLQSLLDLGLECDASTIVWWMDQDESAKAMFAKSNIPEEGMDKLKKRVHGLHSWLSAMIAMVAKEKYEGEYEIWANHPQFDVIKLERLFDLFDLKAPYHHGSVYDLATLKLNAGDRRIAPDEGFLPSTPLVAHRALDDCRFQIAQWVACQKVLGNL